MNSRVIGLIVAAFLCLSHPARAQLFCPGSANALGQASAPITSLPYVLGPTDICLLKVFNSASPGIVKISSISPGSSFPVYFWNEGPGAITFQPQPNDSGNTVKINGQTTLTLVQGQGADFAVGPDGNWYANATAPGATLGANTFAGAQTAPGFIDTVLSPLLPVCTTSGKALTSTPCPADNLTVQPSPATSPVTLGSLATPQMNVKQFGAKCDGSTDDSTAFARAASLFTSGTLLITGTCIVNTSVINWGNISLAGTSPAASVIKLKSGSVFSSGGNWLLWAGRTGFFVQNLTINLNGATVTSGLQEVFGFYGSSNFSVLNNQIIGAGSSGFLHIVTNVVTNATIAGNYINQPLPYTTQNQGINVECGASVTLGLYIENNILVNTAMNICAGAPFISFNDISGWAYGGGVTTQQNTAKSFRPTFIGNNIHDGSPTLDVNVTRSIGIENWAAQALFVGNIARNNGGDGFDAGGQKSVYVGNYACDNNQATPLNPAGSGFRVIYFDSTFNGTGSTFEGNVTDCNSGTTQIYGYSDQSSSVGGIHMGTNSWAGSTAATNFLGAGPLPVPTYGLQVLATVFTVATLPTCNAAANGSKTVVSDGSAPSYLTSISGGGSVRTPVFCNGSAWVAD